MTPGFVRLRRSVFAALHEFVALANVGRTPRSAADAPVGFLGPVDSARLMFLILAGLVTAAFAHAQTPSQTLLNQYCVTCHNEKLKTGGLALDKLDVNHAGADAETWEKVVRKVRAGMMPPPRAHAARPASSLDAFAGTVETALDRAAAANPNPGRAPLHRMNRGEYANAIRDLLAVDVDPATLLPADDSRRRFRQHCRRPCRLPALLERYVSAAAKISRLAVGDPETAPLDVTYTVKGDLTQTVTLDGLPLGTRRRHSNSPYNFPLDGEYLIQAVPGEAQLRPGIRRRSRGPGTRGNHRRPARQDVQAGRSGHVLHAREARLSDSLIMNLSPIHQKSA